MSIETDDLKQDAVLWTADAVDNYGNRTAAAAVGVKVRWEDGQGQIQNGLGDVVAYDATVYVSQLIELGSVLYEGTEAAYDAAVAAGNSPQLYKAVGRKAIPDVKAENTRRSVVLARYKGSLPTFT